MVCWHCTKTFAVIGVSLILIYLASLAAFTLLLKKNETFSSWKPSGEQVLSNYAFDSWERKNRCDQYPPAFRYIPVNWSYTTDHMDDPAVYCGSLAMQRLSNNRTGVVIYRHPYQSGWNNEIAYLRGWFLKPATKMSNDTLQVSFLLKLGNSTHPTSQVMLILMNSQYEAAWVGEFWLDQKSGTITYGWFDPAINYWRWLTYSTAFVSETWYRIGMTFEFHCTENASCGAQAPASRLSAATLQIRWWFQKIGENWTLIDTKQIDARQIFWLYSIVIGDSGPHGTYSGYGIWAGERDIDGAWLLSNRQEKFVSDASNQTKTMSLKWASGRDPSAVSLLELVGFNSRFGRAIIPQKQTEWKS